MFDFLKCKNSFVNGEGRPTYPSPSSSLGSPYRTTSRQRAVSLFGFEWFRNRTTTNRSQTQAEAYHSLSSSCSRHISFHRNTHHPHAAMRSPATLVMVRRPAKCRVRDTHHTQSSGCWSTPGLENLPSVKGFTLHPCLTTRKPVTTRGIS
jgi:hypothetical protein